ncbi:MAG: hypothetical protein IPN59_13840 [Holophaga sp.]|nr:hypothetical protein [Holophaga sp.]
MTVNTIYTATLQIRSNDPLNPNIGIPVRLTVKPSVYRLNLPVLLR